MHRFLRAFEPWGIVLALFGVVIALVTIWVDLEDRQAERTFRAWQLVLTVPSAGSSRREALEYLNREFDGFLCGAPVEWASGLLTGNRRRRCLFPQKERESLAGIEEIGADLSTADLTGAFLMGADLTRANLVGANLTRAFLAGTDLTQAQLDTTCGLPAPVRIPMELTWKSGPCPGNPQ